MLLSHAFTCSIYAPTELKILAGFLTRQLCQISYHTNVSTALLSWKCWKEVTVYADLMRVPVSCVLFLWPSLGVE